MTKNHLLYIFSIIILAGCGNNDPKKEDVPELITKVILTFTPTTGSPVVATATDPDGEGVQSMKTDGPIALSINTTYLLTIQMINGLAQPNDSAYDVTKEVRDKGVEHQFYFNWSANEFTNTVVDYSGGSDSKDQNGLPLGLTTTWATKGNHVAVSDFQVILKHQPGLKSSTSTVSDGETDLDITFGLSVN